MNAGPVFQTAPTSNPAAIIARHRADLLSSAHDISRYFPNGWEVRATSGGPRSALEVAAEILHHDLRIMRMTVDIHGVQFIPAVNGLSPEQMDKIAKTLATAIERHREAKAKRALNPMPDGLSAAIETLDVVEPRPYLIGAAGKPRAVLEGAFSTGPRSIDTIQSLMEEGDVFVGTDPLDLRNPRVESWWVLRNGTLVEIDEAEVRRLADTGPSPAP